MKAGHRIEDFDQPRMCKRPSLHRIPLHRPMRWTPGLPVSRRVLPRPLDHLLRSSRLPWTPNNGAASCTSRPTANMFSSPSLRLDARAEGGGALHARSLPTCNSTRRVQTSQQYTTGTRPARAVTRICAMRARSLPARVQLQAQRLAQAALPHHASVSTPQPRATATATLLVAFGAILSACSPGHPSLQSPARAQPRQHARQPFSQDAGEGWSLRTRPAYFQGAIEHTTRQEVFKDTRRLRGACYSVQLYEIVFTVQLSVTSLQFASQLSSTVRTRRNPSPKPPTRSFRSREARPTATGSDSRGWTKTISGRHARQGGNVLRSYPHPTPNCAS